MVVKDSLSLDQEIELLEKAKVSMDDFGDFYEYFLPVVYRYINVRVGFNQETTEDLTEKVFVKILERIEKIQGDPRRGLKPYLYTVARNMVIDYFRVKDKEKKDVTLDEGYHNPTEGAHLEKLIQKEEQEVIREIVRGLSEKEQEMIALRFGAGLRHREIGKRLEMSEDNVGVVFHRIFTKIRKEFEKGESQ